MIHPSAFLFFLCLCLGACLPTRKFNDASVREVARPGPVDSDKDPVIPPVKKGEDGNEEPSDEPTDSSLKSEKDVIPDQQQDPPPDESPTPGSSPAPVGTTTAKPVLDDSAVEPEPQVSLPLEQIPGGQVPSQGQSPKFDRLTAYSAFQFHSEGTSDQKIAPKINNYCPLVGMTVEGISPDRASVSCEVTEAGQYWNLAATLEKGDKAKLWCSSRCIHWQKNDHETRVSREVAKFGYRGEDSKNLSRASSSFCALKKVKFEGMLDKTESAGCNIREQKDTWVVSAVFDNAVQGYANERAIGGAWCKADCLSWDHRKYEVSGLYSVAAFHPGSRDSKMIANRDHNFCALTGITIKGIDTNDKRALCEVYIDQNQWFIKASISDALDAQVECQARCLSWH